MQTLEKAAVKGKKQPNPLRVSPRNIHLYKSSKLIYAVRDLEKLGVNPSAAAKVFMARGIARAFLIRRRLLHLDRELQNHLSQAYKALRTGSVSRPRHGRVDISVRKYYKHLGYIEALKDMRREVTGIVLNSAFEVPEGDLQFQQLLRVSSKSLINS